MFQPMIPMSGLGGLKFLQATYDRQLESFTRNPSHARDVEQFREKLAQPMAVEEFLDDPQLLRVALTANGLAGEEWKRGFIDKVLTESADPDSTFLQRLNNTAYSAFAETFSPTDGQIVLTPAQIDEVVGDYDRYAFEAAVGEVDNGVRLSLNFEARISEIVGSGSNETASMYRILGDVPIRTLLETALNLPSDIRQLPLDQQASVFREKLSSQFGISQISQLTEPDMVQTVIERFSALDSLSSGVSSNSPASTALSLLSNSGVGGIASQNLLLSRIG